MKPKSEMLKKKGSCNDQNKHKPIVIILIIDFPGNHWQRIKIRKAFKYMIIESVLFCLPIVQLFRKLSKDDHLSIHKFQTRQHIISTSQRYKY